MNLPVSQAAAEASALPAMVTRAAKTLASATSAAEVLEAREMASLAYDVAKRTARLARAKDAHDELLSKVHRAQADALEIEAGAKRRLADEYDAAQDRGEVAKHSAGNPQIVPERNDLPATAAEVGLSRKDIHEARMIRDAEEASPGVVKQAINEAVEAGEEPTRAKVRRAVLKTVKPDGGSRPPIASKAAICKQVREAIYKLTGLPSPEKVLNYFAGTDEAVLVNERLGEAATWLAAFADLWPEDADA